jgi:hypothetical protein
MSQCVRVERHVLPTDNQDNVSEWRDMSYPQTIRIMCQSGETCLSTLTHYLDTDNQDNVSEWRDMSYPQTIRIMCQSGETCLLVLNQDNVSEWRDMSYPQSIRNMSLHSDTLSWLSVGKTCLSTLTHYPDCLWVRHVSPLWHIILIVCG